MLVYGIKSPGFPAPYSLQRYKNLIEAACTAFTLDCSHEIPASVNCQWIQLKMDKEPIMRKVRFSLNRNSLQALRH